MVMRGCVTSVTEYVSHSAEILRFKKKKGKPTADLIPFPDMHCSRVG